jgi:hypothetical protein
LTEDADVRITAGRGTEAHRARSTSLSLSSLPSESRCDIPTTLRAQPEAFQKTEVISTDLQDCERQISEIESLEQNGNVTAIEESRRMAEGLDPNKNRSIDAKEFLSGKITELPEPYLIVRDSPLAIFQNITGITFNNLAEVINILARKHNYRIIISTACDNHTMYVFMEKIGSLK